MGSAAEIAIGGVAATAMSGEAGTGRRLNGYLLVGGIMIAVLVLVTVAAPLLRLPDPNALDPIHSLRPLGAPGHPLGTDQLGRDLLSRLVYGGRITLLAGVVASVISTAAGVALGVIAGYFSKWTDAVVMRLLDVLLSFPFILLAILIVAFFGPSTFNALIAIAIANLPFFARIVRSEALKLREQQFILAAEALGASHFRTLFRHILPNLLPLVFSTFFLNVGWMISQTSALSFLGLGTQPPTADWGSMLAEAQSFMDILPNVAMLPGLMIAITVVGFNILGLGLKAYLLRGTAA